MGAQERAEEAGAPSVEKKLQKTSKEVYFCILPDKYEPLIEDDEETEETAEERRRRKEEKKRKRKKTYKKYRKIDQLEESNNTTNRCSGSEIAENCRHHTHTHTQRGESAALQLALPGSWSTQRGVRVLNTSLSCGHGGDRCSTNQWLQGMMGLGGKRSGGLYSTCSD
ncbi:protein PXR1 isoform X1 [Archocentrus centrarchus]|uniref:protein PXR1 isoform X1 n=1 Tax=Archocentrus centrarchus TaxID=63155 RepID=UPI0011EA11BD|nr:protein PXR1-like isoform X1 [Archocentrus centrarchus]